ncbi:MAG: sensor histidine kinase [Bradymonadia bacterium]
MRGPGIQRLILSVNVLALLIPLLALLLFRVYETHLIRQTERRLIAESALIGEAWRSALLEIQGVPTGEGPDISPSWAIVPDVFPIEPVLDLADPDQEVMPPDNTPPTRFASDRSGPEWRAGAAIKPMLDRAKRVNLSGARVINAEGCVVASTADEIGQCVEHLPEVRAALGGRYAAVARPRHSSSPQPSLRSPLGAISRRGTLRVFTATPLFADGQIIGVVRMSRTSIDPLEALYRQRRTLGLAFVGSLLLIVGMSFFFARVITAPVRAITAAAEAIAAGRPREPLPRGLVPSEISTLSAALDEMTAQLKARAEYITEFVGNVSHELKTPLSSVRGATELLRGSWDDMSPAQRDRFLANIDAATARMTRQVSRLLQLARIEHQGEQVEEIPIRAWLEGFVSRFDPGEGVTARCVVEGPEALPEHLVIAPEHLESVVGNLVDNALLHGEAPIEIIAKGVGDQVCLEVVDHGPGISEGNQRRLFERFFTTSRDDGGTGLGLAIVQAVAQSRGGQVGCETRPGETRFRVVL